MEVSNSTEEVLPPPTTEGPSPPVSSDATSVTETKGSVAPSSPIEAITRIITENQNLWVATNTHGIAAVDHSDANRAVLGLQMQVTEQAASLIEKAVKKGQTLTDADVTRQVERSVDIRIGEPRNLSNDTNLALLRAFGSVPEGTTSLPDYLNGLPRVTDHDHQEHRASGIWPRPVRTPETAGISVCGLPTSVPGVQLETQRFYSGDSVNSQLGIRLEFSPNAIKQILPTTPATESQKP